jgi:DEAD/DEAH box helicase domain-containing protein
MQKEIIFDIETVGDIRNFDALELTVISIYEYDTDTYRSFYQDELTQLWPILERSGRLIGYNSEHFDIPILNKYYTGDLTRFPHLDMLKVIKDTNGKRYKLDDIAKATLEIAKSADGLQAMRWWEEGKREEVKKYCEQDVRVTKELYDYGLANKMLYVNNITGELMPIAVNFDAPTAHELLQQSSGLNMTLPF